MDLPLFHALLSAIPPTCSLILVGDEDQLPSVGPGAVLSDVIKSGTIDTVRLTQVFRQQEESSIVKVAHLFNCGETPDFRAMNFSNIEATSAENNFFFIESSKPHDIVEQICSLISSHLTNGSFGFNFDPLHDIQVLTPMAPGILGSRNLNSVLQKTLNPPSEGKYQVEARGYLFREGDKVMQLLNNYDKDVFNGETGFIRKIRMAATHQTDVSRRRRKPSKKSGAEQEQESHCNLFVGSNPWHLPLVAPGYECEIQVEFDRHSELVRYGPKEIDQIVPSFAITVHKSQGNEFPVILMPVHSDHRMMLERKILYTAITRAKNLVILIGQPHAVSAGVARLDRRITSLHEALLKLIPK